MLRDHAHKLPKKVRKLALKSALSSKQSDGKLLIVASLDLGSAKTRVLAERLAGLGWSSALIIDGDEIDNGFARAARNLTGVQVLPQMGANVYDILRRDRPGADPQGGGRSAGAADMSTEPKSAGTTRSSVPCDREVDQGSEHNQVTFKVRTGATKPQIKEADEGLFEVKVRKVNTGMVKGKVKRGRGGRLGKRSDWKKATISLGEGDTIDVMTGFRRWLSSTSSRPRRAPPARPGGPLRSVEGKAGQGAHRGLSQKGGRNSDGRITMRHRGGGHKRRYRKIDFKRRKFNVPATVERLEYDPNRSAFIALVRYEDGEQGLHPGPAAGLAGR